jgi:hypothetical protein
LKANVAFPILGSDFLTFFKLILDLSGGVLHNKEKTWVCQLAALEVAAEFSVVVPVRFFDQEWPENHSLGTAENNVVRQDSETPVLASLPSPQECGGGSSQPSRVAKVSAISLIKDFKDIFLDTAELPAAKHGVTHHIITDGQPVSALPRAGCGEACGGQTGV